MYICPVNLIINLSSAEPADKKPANKMITTQEIFEKGQVLTLAKAKELTGKKIAATNCEYRMNKPIVITFIIGEIVSAWDDAARNKYNSDKFENFQQYWVSYMTEKQIDKMKTKLILFSSEGLPMYVAHTKYDNFYNEPTFTGSDADREVYFVEL